ncbi:putative PAS/PAC sensor protein [Dethiosulfovibrio peptidovorans DSM 11002]|uniref:PAS/PAC sensor protein n=1 Tax=Dethiosulfovibrio peptidovorans DSM 11002 TaxID=469381 RepID=D2Z7U5_9BACT|nr:HD domain-containing phosphohydrolase [Dethiosulfovibrio peptidovorans]EFC91542.1 putative PAS/PAC sensor protein [Dethiosulfovibrio peptidovorans DSM 11002]
MDSSKKSVEEAVYRFFDRYSVRDLEGTLECFIPDEGLYVGTGVDEGGAGIEGIRAMMERDFNSTSSIKIVIEDLWSRVSRDGKSACAFVRGRMHACLVDGHLLVPRFRKTMFLELHDDRWLQSHSHMSFPCMEQDEKSSFPAVNLKGRYDLLFSRTIDSILFLSPHTLDVIEANHAARSLWGFSKVELEDLSLKDLTGEETFLRVRQLFLEEGSSMFSLEGLALREDGSELEVEISLERVSVAGLSSCLCIVRDISDRKKQERALLRCLEFEKLISSLSSKVLLKDDLDEAIEFALAALGNFSGARSCYIFQFFDRGSIRCMTHCWEKLKGTVERSNFQDFPSDKFEYFVARLEAGDPIVIDDVPAMGDEWGLQRELLQRQGLKSFVVVPFFVSGHLKGYLGFDDVWDSRNWTPEDLVLLQAFCDVLSQAMVKREGEARLRKTMNSSIEVLSRAVEQRDLFTSGHQKRVSSLAEAIGVKLGFDPYRAEGIRIAGLLHDIGKINVPAEILNKPGPLSALEYQLVQRHPEIGRDILGDVHFPWPIAEAVLQHHERLDGSGYPHGLVGDAISLDARILGVADVMEAMCSHRPYRPSLGLDIALNELRKNRDVLYDSDVVDACFQLAEEGFFSEPPFA